MIWRLRAAYHYVLCKVGAHVWRPCGVPLDDDGVCAGSVCDWCLRHTGGKHYTLHDLMRAHKQMLRHIVEHGVREESPPWIPMIAGVVGLVQLTAEIWVSWF